MESLQASCKRLIQQVEQTVIGRQAAIEQLVKAWLCGGHVLLEDVPGVGKTLLAKSLTRSFDFPFKRIQFTSDMFPGDLTGITMPRTAERSFEFVPGPLFAPIVLADELNRANPKTQSALLEAMQERKVTVDGRTYSLPEPFLVIATQNPLEYEGTYPLPEAQMDRFLFRIRLGYPSLSAEVRMLEQVKAQDPLLNLQPIWTHNQLATAQQQVREVYVHDTVRHYIVELSRATRTDERIQLGASPRASAALMRAAQCQAWYEERDYVIPDDVKAVFLPVYAHRIILGEWQEDSDAAESVLLDILQHVKVPASSPASA